MSFAFLFPGQGSQSLHMMDEFDDIPIVKATFDEASAILNIPLWDMLTSDENAIHNTLNTQPLMLSADIATWRAWKKIGGTNPTWVAGHSLGEYSALVAANVITFGDALRIVRLRAEAMQNAVPVGVGAMAAILGLDEKKVRQICQDASIAGIVEPANFNSSEQIVIAGEIKAVQQAMIIAKNQGAKRAILLPVSVPSHCSMMKEVAQKLENALVQIPFKKPTIAVLQNVDATSHIDANKIRQALIDQLHKPVLWTIILATMLKKGATAFAECGPGKVLTGLTKRMQQPVDCFALTSTLALNLAKSTLN
jgi:[acyl-carrier-protein] S-malonyltransferase